jgi:hypothetical protein
MHIHGCGMAQLTIRLPDRLKKQMRRFREVNWSEVTRKAIEARIIIEASRKRREKRVMVEAARRQDELAKILTSRYSGPWSGVEVIRYWRKNRYSSSTPQ